MGHKLQNRTEVWKKLLLDFGKRNRLLNFLVGKRNCVEITEPPFDKLWEYVVVNEREIKFSYAKNVQIDDEGEEIYHNVVNGDVETSKSISDLQKTLKALRYKANTSIEEQGINTLYLAFGMLKWYERCDSSQEISSPVVLVPVRLLIESTLSPYRLVLHDDEIVVNPTLSHKLYNDFGISLPEFDFSHDSPVEYLETLSCMVKSKGWSVNESIYLTNLSFLKINMYKDLDRNEEKLKSNSVIAALVGEQDPILSVEEYNVEEYNDFDHDTRIRPIDTFHVVDADSSQQDAILLSKKGVSFVLQGPPGTGKSQTITNIIAEAIADGRKVLFVSEKMAALQVVYNRLASVGLADFCLTLHSHKTKKKDILRDLANSINIDRTRVRDEALARLEILARKRALLNDYQRELHTPTSGLNVSIYSVNGKLAKLSNVPDIVFPIPEVDSVTSMLLGERVCLLDDLSKTIGKRSEDYVNNVWRNSSIKLLSNALRHEIDSNITTAIPLLKTIGEQHSAICSQLGFEIEFSLAGSDDLISILSFAAKSPTIPVEWVVNHNVDSLMDKACKYKEQVEQIAKITNELRDKFCEPFLDIDAAKCKDNLCSLMRQLQIQIKDKDCNRISQNINKINDEIISITSEVSSLFDEAKQLASKLGISAPNSIEQMLIFARTIQTLAEICKVRPTQKWFNNDEIIRIKSEIQDHKSLHNRVLDSKSAILARFDKEILDCEFYPILQRFRSEYKSFFRVFNGKYQRDRKQLSSYLCSGGKLSYDEALGVLNELKVISDNQAAITANLQQYSEDYGSYYIGVSTQWNDLYNELLSFEQSVCHIYTMTPYLQGLMVQGQLPLSDIVQFNDKFLQSNVELKFEQLTSELSCILNKGSQWSDVEIYMKEFNNVATAFISEYQDVMNMRNASCVYESTICDLDLLISRNTSSNELEKQKDSIRSLYKDYYNGADTDWVKLIDALKYAAEFRDLIAQYNLPKAFVKDVCENYMVISYCNDASLAMSEKKDALKKSITWFVSLFNNGKDFYRCNIYDLVDRMSSCKDKKHLLEEWVDYCSNREKCNSAGLEEYVKKVEELSIDSNYIVDSYLKRFYFVWLDAVLPNFPAVQNFRRRVQTQTINEFCDLDTGQFKIAQARVRERALRRIPDFNSITGARDEIAILKRELSKQRRLMPLRKLFMAIPNLVTSLRPCFMMSPLSVSVFLEAKSYDFDLVIFDEASQVHTEDAIGAIMRGKQVIIVGDTKQLPPTTFFSTSLNEEDYDTDLDEADSDNDAGAYESVLDESVAVLPVRSLRWHYRSRNEHLIAFSNVKIYNNQLITFPSSTESMPDYGVEYVHVKDGVYDRGGKRNNIVEARKVADLVFEHFKKYPQRSLGVVTFSEAQQNAVDAAIRQKKMNNPHFEKYLNEDKEEPFFIKNLENVQGDERDTIIFSIGYARDSKGIMYMNFGPLSREGGYRRLNVAITRAKYNVKLVGSIVPTDIDLDKVSSEGVKMLRSYIEFAQQGIVALEKELVFNNDLEFDSPFEEAVYDFLLSKGYKVVTQVGCSGFRIDMAVEHPTQKGKFAIGIECDGAMYHSSRTARERDRLRQAILEEMGWTIYRVWSTDWIKDHKSEGERLINAIEKAIGRQVVDSNENNSVVDNNSDDMLIPIVEIEEKIEPTEAAQTSFDFELYKRLHPLNLVDDYGKNREKYDIVWDIISLEQPIHFEELCRRIAPAFGRQKATSVVRDEVRAVFQNHLVHMITEENMFIRINDFEDIKVRVPDPDDDYVRPVAYICDEELALAMKTIAKHSFGITPEALFIVTAREFGFKRTGENIISSLRNVYEKMLVCGEVIEVDGKVQVVS